MADDPLRERALDAAAHLCTVATLGLTLKAARLTRGWRRIPVRAAYTGKARLSVIVPARDEERSIERCLRSLLAQTIGDCEIIVVDDRSVDRTAAIVAALAAEYPRLRLVNGEPLPEGWVGKPWALAQGAALARGSHLLFTDADTWHAPEACTSVLAFAEQTAADALTLATYQELGSWGERAVLPTMLALVLLASGTMEQLNDPRDARHALANGQYILVSRAAYDALGGHDALRGEIVEDVAFAKRIKADGRFRLVLAGGEALVRVRMYRSLRELRHGFRKNVYAGAGGDLHALAAGALFTALLSVVPAALAADGVVRRKPLRALEAALCLAAGVAVGAFGLRQTALSRRLAWWAPVGYAICSAIIVDSTLAVRSGRGVAWRGRTYSGRPAEQGSDSAGPGTRPQ